MIGWISAILANGLARKALGLLLAALTIALLRLNFRRAGEHAGHAAERLDAQERNDAIHRQMLDSAALMIAMLWLNGCAMVGSDARTAALRWSITLPPIKRVPPTR